MDNVKRQTSQKQSALNQLASKGLLTTNPTQYQRSLAKLTRSTSKGGLNGRRNRVNKKKTQRKRR
jgi:hypothetical protein